MEKGKVLKVLQSGSGTTGKEEKKAAKANRLSPPCSSSIPLSMTIHVRQTKHLTSNVSVLII
jgi:hypothetical protein